MFLFVCWFYAAYQCSTSIQYLCQQQQHHSLVSVRFTCRQLVSSGLEKEPSCLVLTSLSCSSCLWPRRYRYSMCITSVFLMRALTRNSSRMRGMKPGLSWPARRNCRYRARTCFCSLLCRAIAHSAFITTQGPNCQSGSRVSDVVRDRKPQTCIRDEGEGTQLLHDTQLYVANRCV